MGGQLRPDQGGQFRADSPCKGKCGAQRRDDLGNTEGDGYFVRGDSRFDQPPHKQHF